jgi:acyl-CoA thioesterase-1
VLNKGLFKVIVIIWVILFFSGCSDSQPTLIRLAPDAVILAYGDSLTFGSGSNSETQSYPAILAQLSGLTVIKKGVPGEVTQQGLERLPSVLAQVKPDLVILCHGGNDIIQKLGQQHLKSNLDKMIALIKESGTEVVLIAVPNLMLNIPDLYHELSEVHTVPIELAILQKVDRTPKLKSDYIHPNAAGYKLIAESIHQLLVKSGAL